MTRNQTVCNASDISICSSRLTPNSLSYRTFRLQRFSIITTTSQAWFRLPRAWYCTKLDDYDKQASGAALPQSPLKKSPVQEDIFLLFSCKKSRRCNDVRCAMSKTNETHHGNSRCSRVHIQPGHRQNS